GLAPALLLPALEATGFELLGAHADLRFNAMGVAAGGGFGAVAPLAIALALGVFLAILIVALRWLGARRGARSYETWGCGRALQMARFEYTAAAFANPFARVFAALYRGGRAARARFTIGQRAQLPDLYPCDPGRPSASDALADFELWNTHRRKSPSRSRSSAWSAWHRRCWSASSAG